MWGRLAFKRSHKAADLSGGLPAVPTRILCALGLMLEQGAFGVRCMLVAPVSEMAESKFGMGALQFSTSSKLSPHWRRQQQRNLFPRFGGRFGGGL